MQTYIGVRSDLDITKPLKLTDKEAIWNDLWFTLNTLPGERPKMLDVGSHFRYYLFEPNDAILAAQAKAEITRIVDLDPRIILKNIQVFPTNNTLEIIIEIFMVNINTNELLNFKFLRKN